MLMDFLVFVVKYINNAQMNKRSMIEKIEASKKTEKIMEALK